MNEIEQVVKGLDLLEQVKNIEGELVEIQESGLDEAFIYDSDISTLRKTLETALEQLDNEEIQIVKESEVV